MCMSHHNACVTSSQVVKIEDELHQILTSRGLKSVQVSLSLSLPLFLFLPLSLSVSVSVSLCLSLSYVSHTVCALFGSH